MRTCTLILATWMTLTALLVPPAHAQPAPPEVPTATAGTDQEREARRLSEEGLRHFGAGQYDQAITAFQASYQLVAAPGLLYNIAQAYRLQNNCDEALGHYQRYLATHPPDNLRERALARIAELQTCVRAQPAMPAPPSLAPKPLAAQPLPPSIADLRKAPTEPAPGAEAPRRSTARRVATVATGVLSAGLLSMGGYCAWQAQEASKRVSTVFETGMPWNPEIEEDGLRYQRWAWGLSLTGLVAAGITTWLALRD